MTFSIAGSDASGHWGVAISTARPAVGGRCIFVNQFGAVATQATVNTELGYRVSQTMSAERCPQDAIAAAVHADAGARFRQLIAVDALGRIGAWTGEGVPSWAGQRLGESVVAAGNILAGPATIDAMVSAFANTPGALAGRLVAALDAGQQAGGDTRGRQSAAVAVGIGRAWPLIDLRVDDHPEPVAELERLVTLWEESWGVYDRTGNFPPANPPGRLSQ